MTEWRVDVFKDGEHTKSYFEAKKYAYLFAEAMDRTVGNERIFILRHIINGVYEVIEEYRM